MIGGGYSEQNEYDQHEKYLANEMRAYILVSHVINWETWLHALGMLYTSYNSDTSIEQLDDGYKTECRLRMSFFPCCIVKLYCHVSLCVNFHILIVSNYIIHLGIKVISWIWLVGDVTKIPDFSDHI